MPLGHFVPAEKKNHNRTIKTVRQDADETYSIYDNEEFLCNIYVALTVNHQQGS